MKSLVIPADVKSCWLLTLPQLQELVKLIMLFSMNFLKVLLMWRYQACAGYMISSGDESVKRNQHENGTYIHTYIHTYINVMVAFPTRSSMSLKGERCSVWEIKLISWMLRQTTCCHHPISSLPTPLCIQVQRFGCIHIHIPTYIHTYIP